MKKLTASHFNDAMAYALLEPEFNLFLIGDLENYGLESENVSVYTADTWTGGTLPYLFWITGTISCSTVIPQTTTRLKSPDFSPVSRCAI